MMNFMQCSCGGDINELGRCRKCDNQCITISGDATFTVEVAEDGKTQSIKVKTK